MDASLVPAIYGSLLLAGLAGSLHCIGMCGPILAAFSQVFAGARPEHEARFALLGDFVFYHAGRIWTYGLLGIVVGLAGHGLRASGAMAGLQRGTSLAFAVAIILSGLVLGGIVPSPKLERVIGACGAGKLRGRSWFATLVRTPGATARLLLGALLGLLPCGLVYTALVLASTLPSPAQAALGMIVFGLGTVPSLSAVLLLGRVVPVWLRVHGTRIVGLALVVIGCLMLARALVVTPEGPGCPGCEPRTVPSAAAVAPTPRESAT